MTRSLHKEMDPKKQLDLSIFMIDLMKSRQAWRNMIGQGIEGKCCELG